MCVWSTGIISAGIFSYLTFLCNISVIPLWVYKDISHTF